MKRKFTVAFDIDEVVISNISYVLDIVSRTKGLGVGTEGVMRIYEKAMHSNGLSFGKVIHTFEEEFPGITSGIRNIYKSQNFYKDRHAIDGFVKLINKLTADIDVIFLTQSSGLSHGYKFKLIEEFIDDPVVIFVDGDDKWRIPADVFVDDNIKNCKRYLEYNPETTVINFTGCMPGLSGYFPGDISRNAKATNNYDEIYYIITSKYKISS